MKTFHILSLAVMMILTSTACQGNCFYLEGSVEGLNEGDTIYVSNDPNMGIPLDTLIVKDGKFEWKDNADEAKLFLIYAKRNPSVSTIFFREPGTIKIHLATNPAATTIGGTKANDAMNETNHLTFTYSKKMQEIATTLSDGTATEEAQRATMETIQSMQKELTQKVIAIAEKNIDNEFGYFILTNLNDEENFSYEKRSALLEKLPDAFKARPEAIAMREMLQKMAAVSIGNVITDFSMPTPEGTEMSVMSEVVKNQLTILDFWASWCGPCRAESPFMVELYKKYSEKGLGIIGVSFDNNKEAWVKAIADLGLSWSHISDLKGWQSDAAQMFQVNAIPFILVLDSKGTIVQKGLRGEELEKFISKNLK